MGLFSSEKPETSPVSSLDNAHNYDGYPNTGEYDDDLHVECPPHTTESKMVRKIDIRVIPCLCIMYRESIWQRILHAKLLLTRCPVLAFLDRVNIANANVYGLSKQLGMGGNQYNIALVIFFVP